MGGDNLFYYGGGACCFVSILTAILVGISFKSLDTNEFGLDYDSFSQTIGSTLYTGGTKFLGLAHSFITFPSTQQVITFADPSVQTTDAAEGLGVSSRSADGLPLTISFSFNYRFNRDVDSLTSIYINFGNTDQVSLLYQRISRNIVRGVCSNYLAADFFGNLRTEIQLAMQTAMATQLSAVGSQLESFQLLKVGIPQSFQDARTRQQNAVQQVTQATNALNVAIINARTDVLVAQQNAALIVSQAVVNAQQSALTTAATINALQTRFAADRVSYANVSAALSLTTPQLLSYVWLDAQAQGAASGVTVNVAQPSASLS